MTASTRASVSPDVIVGVDTHKNIHVAVALAPNGGKLGHTRIPVTRNGYAELIRWALNFGAAPLFAIEGTGCYGAGLTRHLIEQEYPVIEVNRPDRSTRRRIGKDDIIDAEAAARSYLAGTASATPKTTDAQVEMIRLLKVAKDSAADSRTRAINQMRALLVTAPALLRERLDRLTLPQLIQTCAAFRPGEMGTPAAAAKRALRSLARRVQNLETELAELNAELDGLTRAVCPGLRETYGAGVEVTATLLSVAGDNPERLRSESAFAALCGVCPLPASSGQTNRHRLNRGGNRQANAALHRIAIVRLRWHEKTKAYVARRTAEGLSRREILRCLKRFIAREIFHLLQGRTPLRTTAST